MANANESDVVLPKSSRLRWEIGIALIIKITLLVGLWFLIFRWQDRPISKPDIAAHLAMPDAQTPENPDFDLAHISPTPC